MYVMILINHVVEILMFNNTVFHFIYNLYSFIYNR